jgi:hypothetical protein
MSRRVGTQNRNTRANSCRPLAVGALHESIAIGLSSTNWLGSRPNKQSPVDAAERHLLRGFAPQAC